MARGGISSDTSNFIIKIAFVILAIVVIYILIRRHPGFIEWLKGGSVVGIAATVGETKAGPNIYLTGTVGMSV